MWRLFRRKKGSGQTLTEAQQRLLCEMMYHAFIEIRMIGYQGKGEQAARLASAFHNLPLHMHSPAFDWAALGERLEHYQEQYPRERQGPYDYVAALGDAREAA